MRLLPFLLFAGLISDAPASTSYWTQADADLKSLQSCLEMFRIHTGRYPSGEEGFKALLERPERWPDSARWKKCLEEMPRDPWGNLYGYVEGNGFSSGDGYGYGLYSMGPDVKSATQGNDPDDLNSWSDSIPTIPPPLWVSILGRDLPVAGVGFLLGILAYRLRKAPSTP